MKVLILGGAGFLGSMIGTWLIQNTRHFVISADDLSAPSAARNVQGILGSPGRARFYLLNITDSSMMSKMLKIERPEKIIFAAGSETLDRAKIVYALADLIHDLDFKTHIIAIDTEQSNVKDYAAYDQLGIPEPAVNSGMTLVKTCRIFGPRQDGRFFIPQHLVRMLNNYDLVNGAEHEKIYEWMYVLDLYNAIALIMEQDNPGTLYNAGSGILSSEANVVQIMADIMGHKEDETNSFEILDGMDSRLLYDLGWQAKYELRAALEHTMRWYNDNLSWVWEKGL